MSLQSEILVVLNRLLTPLTASQIHRYLLSKKNYLPASYCEALLLQMAREMKIMVITFDSGIKYFSVPEIRIGRNPWFKADYQIGENVAKQITQRSLTA